MTDLALPAAVLRFCLVALALMPCGCGGQEPLAGSRVPVAPGIPVHSWVTSEGDPSQRLTPQASLVFTADGTPRTPPVTAPETPAKETIDVDDVTAYQTILGIGASLDHSSCFNLFRLDEPLRNEVAERLFSPDRGIGMNLMRLCIGTPDFTDRPWYSYDDMPAGASDPELSRFSIEPDREQVIPVIRMAMRFNPEMRFFASPWSPPAWMKDSGSLCGGRLLPQNYDPYASYFVKFLQAYAAEGIPVRAVTVQNEPGVDDPAYPSCRWTWSEEQAFVRDFLGPRFGESGIDAGIWVHDHNFCQFKWDLDGCLLPDFFCAGGPWRPDAVLSDGEAAQYIEGAAFHHYSGNPAAMSQLHEMHPEKGIFFTEGSTFGSSGALSIIAYFRNWARSYNAWVTLIDQHGEPNPGPHDCAPTMVVLNDDLSVTYNIEYFIYGQFSRFVRPGAARIASSEGRNLWVLPFLTSGFNNVAFRNPDGSIVLVVANADRFPVDFEVRWRGLSFAASAGARSVSTYLWDGPSD